MKYNFTTHALLEGGASPGTVHHIVKTILVMFCLNTFIRMPNNFTVSLRLPLYICVLRTRVSNFLIRLREILSLVYSIVIYHTTVIILMRMIKRSRFKSLCSTISIMLRKKAHIVESKHVLKNLWLCPCYCVVRNARYQGRRT